MIVSLTANMDSRDASACKNPSGKVESASPEKSQLYAYHYQNIKTLFISISYNNIFYQYSKSLKMFTTDWTMDNWTYPNPQAKLNLLGTALREANPAILGVALTQSRPDLLKV